MGCHAVRDSPVLLYTYWEGAASAADEVVKRIPPQRDLPFTLMNFTPSVAFGDSSLKREPRQDSELHLAASERNQYFVRLCDFKFDAKTIVSAGIK